MMAAMFPVEKNTWCNKPCNDLRTLQLKQGIGLQSSNANMSAKSQTCMHLMTAYLYQTRNDAQAQTLLVGCFAVGTFGHCFAKGQQPHVVASLQMCAASTDRGG